MPHLDDEQMMTILTRARHERNGAVVRILGTTVRNTLNFMATVAETVLRLLPVAMTPQTRASDR
ncbi:MAG: hypothetical protein IAE88_05695 [Rhodobacteraceae bacterium]|uniref:hypothetical protein n=1 Tax=Accumulibacter sp. TaxID=2053492 RepID=UPI001A078B63|nr:hypothetical protein [Accumulibacter sp.]MBE2258328.1 hypothetical protein [Paracoccaceae bacterium]